MGETITERVWNIAESLVTQEGLEIVDVEFRRENRGMVLRLYLDRLGGVDVGDHTHGVNLDDLTRVSRQLGDLLDARDAVPGSYTLEVSSPGIHRRLRRADQFKRYLGKRVRVRTVVPLDGRRVFAGALQAVETDGIRVAVDDTERFIRFPEIAQANYEPEA